MIHYMDLPHSVRAVTLRSEDGEYAVLVNTRQSYETQKKALEHELRHIERCDFEKEDVEKIEKSSHE